MRAVMGGLLLALAGGCQSAPEDRLSWRESWELLALLEGRQLIDARVVVGNTGVLRGQAQLKLDRWTRRETPLRFAQQAAPVAVRRDLAVGSIALAGNGLLHEDAVWSLRVADEHVNALLRLEPLAHDGGDALPQVTWASGDGERWQAQADVAAGSVSGWMAAGERGGLVRGVGLLLRRSGAGQPALPRQAAFVVTQSVQLGVDVQGEGRLAWAWIDGVALPLDTLAIRPAEVDGGLVVDLRPAAPLVATFTPGRSGGQTLPYEHLTRPERWLLERGRDTTRTVQDAEVEVWYDGQPQRLSGILLDVRRAP